MDSSKQSEFDKLTPELQAAAKRIYVETREKLKNPLIFDVLAANPKQDPYFGHTYALMVANVAQEEQVLLNLIEALSESNQRMASMIDKMLEGSGQSPLANIHDHNVRSGRGPLPKGGVVEFPGGQPK